MADDGRHAALEEDAIADERAAESGGQGQAQKTHQVELPSDGLNGAGGGHEEDGEQVEEHGEFESLVHGVRSFFAVLSQRDGTGGGRYIGPGGAGVKSLSGGPAGKGPGAGVRRAAAAGRTRPYKGM